VGNGHTGRYCFNTARTTEQVPGHGFRGTNGYVVSCIPQGSLDSLGFGGIISSGAGAVGIDIANLFGLHIGIFQAI
jgi:hypothetical protein